MDYIKYILSVSSYGGILVKEENYVERFKFWQLCLVLLHKKIKRRNFLMNMGLLQEKLIS